MKSLTKNTFVAEVNISLPCEGKVELNRWLNLQHTGKELISQAWEQGSTYPFRVGEELRPFKNNS